jgi:hypothetical protein
MSMYRTFVPGGVYNYHCTLKISKSDHLYGKIPAAMNRTDRVRNGWSMNINRSPPVYLHNKAGV